MVRAASGERNPVYDKACALYLLKEIGTHLKMSAIPLYTDVYAAIRI